MIERWPSVRSACAVVLLVVAAAATAHAQATGAPEPEPDKSMTSAHDGFVKGDMNKASEEIKKAATYVHAQEQKVVKSAAAGVKKAGDDLDRLSADVKQGAVKSADDLKKAFAKADHALAAAWHATAESEQKAGQNTSAAVANATAALEGAAKWTGSKLDAGAQAAVDAVHRAERGAKMGMDAVGRTLRGIGQGIADMGKRIGGS
jgi:hypothetical protein